MDNPPATPKETASPSHKDNNFNFLRLMMATLVMVQHAPEMIDGDRHREILTQIFHTFSFGALAVNGFFTLSGYLIVQSWIRQPALLDFLKKRILRIYPGFIVASLISALIVGPLGANAAVYFSHFSLLHYLKSVITLDAPAIPEVFPGQPFPLVNGSLWTIAYEFRCYLFVALFGLLGLFRYRAVWLGGTLAALALMIASFSVNIPSRIFPGSISAIGDFHNVLRFATFFGAGGCFYLYRDRIRFKDSWAAVALPLVLLALFRQDTGLFAMSTLGAYLFFWFAFKPIPPLRKFGTTFDISYGVYLYGWPVQKLLYWFFPGLFPWVAFVIALPLTYLCGATSWILVESPMLRLKQKR